MKQYDSGANARSALIQKGDAEWMLPFNGRLPASIFATKKVVDEMTDKVFEQLQDAATAPGVDRMAVTPDAHPGMGVPVGSIMASRTTLYPGMVGPDISCSMSYLQTDVADEAIADKRVRRALIDAICARIPTGAGSRQAPKALRIPTGILEAIPVYGATPHILEALGIPLHWAERCEDSTHNEDVAAKNERLQKLFAQNPRLAGKLSQIGSLGGGNHFAEAQTTTIANGMEELASHFGLQPGKVGFLTHCGSRGFGYQLAGAHFKALEQFFITWGIPFPGGEKELVYAPIGTPEATNYTLDMALGANFAVVNHLLLNRYIWDAFAEVLPGTKAELVYHISHNIGRREVVDGNMSWVFRKGATRAFPAGHPALKGTRYEATGHPILLPGNPQAGSRIMVALPGAEKALYSINHGAGRAMGRNEAKRRLDQAVVDATMHDADILSNCRRYPVDEAPQAYKDFDQVNASVEAAGLAKTVAHLRARFVIKDGDQDKEGMA